MNPNYKALLIGLIYISSCTKDIHVANLKNNQFEFKGNQEPLTAQFSTQNTVSIVVGLLFGLNLASHQRWHPVGHCRNLPTTDGMPSGVLESLPPTVVSRRELPKPSHQWWDAVGKSRYLPISGGAPSGSPDTFPPLMGY